MTLTQIQNEHMSKMCLTHEWREPVEDKADSKSI